MLTRDHQLRVRYAETDRMGYVYYGNYAAYFEVGRVELLRSMGFSYRRLEEQGWMLPVRDLRIRYMAPARYDDLLTVRTTVPRLPGARIEFDYLITNQQGRTLVEGATTLVFIDAQSMRPVRAPDDLVEAMGKHFITDP
ncbi:MAG: acyl-CoA thioesterase [Flavobacteriales bacterium]|nr:acyl-CoA thioesterase [Flavobacteriales bacterium]